MESGGAEENTGSGGYVYETIAGSFLRLRHRLQRFKCKVISVSFESRTIGEYLFCCDVCADGLTPLQGRESGAGQAEIPFDQVSVLIFR